MLCQVLHAILTLINLMHPAFMGTSTNSLSQAFLSHTLTQTRSDPCGSTHFAKVVFPTTLMAFSAKCWAISLLVVTSTVSTINFRIASRTCGSLQFIHTDKIWVGYTQHFSLGQLRFNLPGLIKCPDTVVSFLYFS